MEIIPAIDIIDGKCVRLTKGDYAVKTIYNEDPLEVALAFEAAGMTRLHLVDLDGAKAGAVRNWKILDKIASRTKLLIDFSGGISSKASLDICFNSGAGYAAIGSMAVNDEFEVSGWLLAYGAHRFIIGADVRDEHITIRGWTQATDLHVFDLVDKYKQKGVSQFFCTDVNKDGLLEGPATDLYKKILSAHPSIKLIASGGVSKLEDVVELEKTGCSGVIIGKAIYENKIKLSELKPYVH
ncbi:MAG TPA: 1-(5-phosphoribosyl)-5-[(5-phosphoribosylamino)methylideneamino]imidazole-4-carboxamide isomerase [Chitinophagaceae bacterium]